MKSIFTFITLLLISTSIHSQKIKFGKVSKEQLLEKSYPQDSTAEAAFLYKKQYAFFEFNSSSGSFDLIINYHTRIKIYNKDGINKGNFSVPIYTPSNGRIEKVTSLKGFTFNLEDGKIIKTKFSKNKVFKDRKSKYWSVQKFTMPNVKAGAIIDVKYSIVSPYWDIKDLKFQADIPTKILECKTNIPEYYTYNKRQYGQYHITPKISRTNKTINLAQGGGMSTFNMICNITEYNATDIPALEDDEPFVSNIENYRGGVKFELASIRYPNSGPTNYNTTWKAVAQKIFESASFGGELSKSSYFKDDLNAILDQYPSPGARIVAIHEFVKNKVKWNGIRGKYTYNGVRKAYKEGVGNTADINLMLVSMLQKAGLNANPVLVSTRSNGIPLFPTTEGYNYVVAAVTIEGDGVYLLDGTEKYSSPNILPLRDLNWYGRMVFKNGNSKMISMSPKKHSEKTYSLSIQFDEDFNASGFLKTTFKGLSALNYRSKNNLLAEEDHISKLESKFEIEIDDFKVKNDVNIFKPFTRFIKFQSSDFTESINEKIYIKPMLFLAEDKNPFKAEERSFPIEFGTPWKESYRISLNIPAGYQIESLPESFGVGISDKSVVFKYIISKANNTISIQATLQCNEPIIQSKYYDEIKGLFENLIAKESEKITLSKATNSTAQK